MDSSAWPATTMSVTLPSPALLGSSIATWAGLMKTSPSVALTPSRPVVPPCSGCGESAPRAVAPPTLQTGSDNRDGRNLYGYRAAVGLVPEGRRAGAPSFATGR